MAHADHIREKARARRIERKLLRAEVEAWMDRLRS